MEQYKSPCCGAAMFKLKLVCAYGPDPDHPSEYQDIKGQPVLVCDCGKIVIPYLGALRNGEIMDELHIN